MEGWGGWEGLGLGLVERGCVVSQNLGWIHCLYMANSCVGWLNIKAGKGEMRCSVCRQVCCVISSLFDQQLVAEPKEFLDELQFEADSEDSTHAAIRHE